MSNTCTRPLGEAREPTPFPPTRRLGSRLAVASVFGSLALLLVAASAPAAVKKFPIPGIAAGPGITVGPDGNVWFAQKGAYPSGGGNFSAEIGKITPAGMLTEYSAGIGLNGEIEGITSGPDGNVWFTATIHRPGGFIMPGEVTTRSVIGKITTSGAVTEYTVGSCTFTGATGPGSEIEACSGTTSDPGALNITSGPDGNLWFAGLSMKLLSTRSSSPGESEGVIGKITTGGAVTEYTAGISGPLRNIAAGPDGNLWFTGSGVGGGTVLIGKITTGGAVTEYRAGITSAPIAIAAGPDGNLWFTEGSRNKIGKITPAGAVTEYRAGITSAPVAITVGSDRNLWFTEPYSGRIARIRTRGAVTVYNAGLNKAFAEGITRGPDGNLWLPVVNLIHSEAADYIARFNPTSTSSKGGQAWSHAQCKSTYAAWTSTHHHATRSQKRVEANKLHTLHGCPLSILK